MKTLKKNKKKWIAPSVQVLNIRKDTFAGSQGGVEVAGKRPGPPPKF